MAGLDLLQGTLDILILRTLSWGRPLHGYAISTWIKEQTDEALLVEEGALYPALHRLEKRGWLDSEWGLSENNRRAKYYRLTAKGRRELRSATAEWDRYVEAVAKVLRPAERPAR